MPPQRHEQQQQQQHNRLRRRRQWLAPAPSRATMLLLVTAVIVIGWATCVPQCFAWLPSPTTAPPSRSMPRRAWTTTTTRCRASTSSSSSDPDDASDGSRSSTSSSSSRSSTSTSHRRRGALSRGGFAARSLYLSVALGGALLGAASTIVHAPAVQARTEPLGIIDELLAECARTDNCASSQDDRPPVFAEPWAYESSAGKAMQRLRDYVAAMPGAEVITADERYLRVEFRAQDGAVDDVEWYFVDPESDAIIEFRSARRGDKGDNGTNLRRLEKIRIALGFEKVPVLRNRRRALFIMESPLDAFGPSYGADAPPPQELGEAYETYKDMDPFSPSWEGPPRYPRPSPPPSGDKKKK